MKNRILYLVLILFALAISISGCKKCECPCTDQYGWKDSNGTVYFDEQECQNLSSDPGSCGYVKTYDCTCKE